MSNRSTCYAYDPIEQIHNQPGHAENNRRTAESMALLQSRGVLDQMTLLPFSPITAKQLQRLHSPRYVQRVQELDERGGGKLDFETYMVPGSFQAALASAGAALAVTRSVVRGEARNGISIMRPPGHHALSERGMGFCIFGNVALAARSAQFDLGLERVLIIDWDVHHGNGTELFFYDDPSVAFISIHQYPLYPGTGGAQEIGIGEGKGFTLNLPMPPGVGDAGYLRAFDEIITPFAHRFQPELILVSSGFDAHWRDPLSEMGVSSTGYARLAQRARDLAEDLCDGRLVVALEGGYDILATSYGLLNTALALMGRDDALEDPFGPALIPETDASELLRQIKHLHHLPPLASDSNEG
jgi:acetoin utilization deacetylase AcuC-like enzyme